MVLDKCELSLELLQKISLQFFPASQPGHGYLLIWAHVHMFCAMSAPPLLQHYHSIHRDEKRLSLWLPSCVWVHLGPAGMYDQSSLFCPHRILSLALLLCPSPQPKSVAKPRGMMALGGGGGMTSPDQPPSPVPPLGVLSLG